MSDLADWREATSPVSSGWKQVAELEPTFVLGLLCECFGVFLTSSTALFRPPLHPIKSALVGQALEPPLLDWLFSALCSRHYPCLSMFNCSEKFPYWLSACLKKKKCDWLRVEFGSARLFRLAEVILRAWLYFRETASTTNKTVPNHKKEAALLYSSCQCLFYSVCDRSTFQYMAVPPPVFTC